MLKINHNAKIRFKGFTPLEINENSIKDLRPGVSSGLSLTGFTLIEVAISLAILAIIAGIFTPVIHQGIDTMLFCRTKEQLAQEARFAMSWISEDLKNNCSSITYLPKPAEAYYPSVGFWTTTPNLYIQYKTNGAQLIRRTTDTSTTPWTVKEFVITDKMRSLAIRGYRTIGAGAIIPLPSSDDNWTDVSQVRFIEIKLSVGDASGPNHYDLITRIHPDFIP